MVDIDSCTNASVQQNDKGSAQGGNEKVHLGPLRLLLGHVRAEATDDVEHGKRCQAKRGIELCVGQALEGIDDDPVWSIASVDLGNAHELADLAGNDVDGGTRHEGADGGERNDLDDPSQTCQTHETDDGARDDGQCRGNDMAGNVRQGTLGLEHDISGNLGHDSDGLRWLAESANHRENDGPYTNGNVLGCGEEPVDEDAHKGRIQAIFNGKLGKLGVSHTLWNDNGSNGNTCVAVSTQAISSPSAV